MNASHASWLCGPIKHDRTAHQAWLFIADDVGHEVANHRRWEWRDW